MNVELTKKLYEACRENNVEHFIFISSIHAMVTHDVPLIDENSELFSDPNVAYDYSKAEAERYLTKQNGMKLTILNPTAVLGPEDPYYSGINKMFRLLQNRKLPVSIPGGFDVVDVRDVCYIIAESIVQQKEGKFLVGGGYYSIKELISKYATIAKVRKPFFQFGKGLINSVAVLCDVVQPIVKRPIETNKYAIDALLKTTGKIDTGKVREEFNWTPKPIDETLKDLNKWIVG